MKYFYTTLLCMLVVFSQAGSSPSLFSQLQSINSNWSQQEDIQSLPIYSTSSITYSDHQLIQMHLQLVESTLNKRSTAGLTAEQKTTRTNLLKHLREYWQTNIYPINNKTLVRCPVFIDDVNTFCAVGYLIKCSGQENLARKIASTFNLSYLRDIKVEGLEQWVQSSGFTLDELAWIQPTYLAQNHSRSLGKGVNGTVYALSGDPEHHKLYVGGNFTQADESVNCNHIVEVHYDETDIFHNTFTALGDGLNGIVYTLYQNDSELIVGGHFDHSGSLPVSNIACWNGIEWKALGEVNGTVKTIEKFLGQIYIGGEFTYSYNGETYQNIAFWDGLNWKPISPFSIGKVNALKAVADLYLLVGGEFTTIDTLVVNNIFYFNNQTIYAMGEGLPAAVYTLDYDGGYSVAAGEFINPSTDSIFGYAYHRYAPYGDWEMTYKNSMKLYNPDSSMRINDFSSGYIAGHFNAGYMYISSNTGIINYDMDWKGFATPNGEVMTIMKIGKRVFFGGSFSELHCGTYSGPSLKYPANNLAIWDADFVGLESIQSQHKTITISPNPLKGTTSIASESGIKSIRILDLNGKLILENTLTESVTELTLQREYFPAGGLYFVTLQTTDGLIQNQKLLVD